MAKEEIFFGINIDTGEVIKDFGTLKKRTKELKKELDGTKVGTKRFEELKKEISSNQATIRRFNRELRQTKSLATRVGQGVTNAFKGVGVALAGAFAVGGLIDVLKSGVKTISEFEQAIKDVAAVSGATERQLELLEKSARNLGKTSIFTAQEVAGLQLELAKLGFTTEEIIEASGGILDLSTAFRIDLSQAAAVTASTLRAFGLDAENTKELTDLMADSFASTALDITKFEESMKLVAPAARQTGRSVKEVTALLGLLANNGLSGSIAGTQLNRVFIELNKRGMTLQQAMNEVAYSADKLGTATNLVGDRGAKALSIFASQSEALSLLRDDFSEVTDEASKLAKQSGDTLVGSFKRLKSAWDEVVLSFSESKGTLREISDGLGEFFGTVAKVRENKNLLEEVGFEESLFFPSDEETQSAVNILAGWETATRRITTFIKENNKEALEDLIKTNEALVDEARRGEASLDKTGEQAAAFANFHRKIVNEAKRGLEELVAAQKKLSEEVEDSGLNRFNILDPIDEDPFANEKVDDSRVDVEIDEVETFEGRLERLNRLTSEQDMATERFIERQEIEREQMRMTAEYEQEMNNIRLESTASLINSTISLLSLSEQSRKRNARLIKALAIAEVGVNLGQELSNISAVNSSPSNLPNLFTFGGAGISVTAIQSAAAIGRAAAQVATISQQKFAKGGILSGPSHAQGGIKTPFGELEGGEAVINKKSTRKHAGLLSAINEDGGGKKFARGGVLGVPNVVTTPDASNAQLLKALNNFDMRPTVSVVEINEAQTRISEIENNSTL